MQTKMPTGSRILDRMLEGGYESDIVTTIYGPPGSGKTILCLLAAINIARKGKKVLYVDTENNFSVERLKQIALDYKKILDNIVFLRPVSFKEQKEAFKRLKDIINDGTGLIVVDTIAMLYRLEIGKTDEVYETNRELGRQISYLSEISTKKNIPVLVTTQIYSDFDNKDSIKIVGGDLLRYGSKCLIELQITPQNNRCCILRKHRSIASQRSIIFKIVESGIIGTKE